MNLQQATVWIKTNLSQEIGANTLRKACGSGRLKGVRKGEGNMHIRRTEWEVTEEAVIQFVREEYHPRPSRRVIKHKGIHIPNELSLIEIQHKKGNLIEEESKAEAKVFYRVIEHLFQRTLPIHGERMGKYDTRIVESKIRSKVKAETLVQRLEAQAYADNLSHQLQYKVESYTISKKEKDDY
jgi:hypothetical protein